MAEPSAAQLPFLTPPPYQRASVDSASGAHHAHPHHAGGPHSASDHMPSLTASLGLPPKRSASSRRGASGAGDGDSPLLDEDSQQQQQRQQRAQQAQQQQQQQQLQSQGSITFDVAQLQLPPGAAPPSSGVAPGSVGQPPAAGLLFLAGASTASGGGPTSAPFFAAQQPQPQPQPPLLARSQSEFDAGDAGGGGAQSGGSPTAPQHFAQHSMPQLPSAPFAGGERGSAGLGWAAGVRPPALPAGVAVDRHSASEFPMTPDRLSPEDLVVVCSVCEEEWPTSRLEDHSELCAVLQTVRGARGGLCAPVGGGRLSRAPS